MPTYNFGGSAGGDEVTVDPLEPTDPNILLWVDTDEPATVLDTFVISSSTGAAEVITDSDATSTSGLRIRQDGINRWLVADDSADRLVIARYDKLTGAWIETSASIDSDTGEFFIKKPLIGSGAYLYASGSVASNIATTTQIPVTGGTNYLWGGCTTSASNINVPITGLYRVGFTGGFATGSAGTVRLLALHVNGAIPNGPTIGQGVAQFGFPSAGTSGYGNILSANGMYKLAEGDTVGIYGRQDSGSTIAVTAGFFIELVKVL